MRLFHPVFALCLALPGWSAEVHPPGEQEIARFSLHAEQTWQLDPPDGERFDASGLLLTRVHGLLTVNDRGTGLYQIHLAGRKATLRLLTNVFTPAQLAPWAKEKIDRYDLEGLAQDDTGRLYVCEEANRWILRFDPHRGGVERLAMDWRPVEKYFHPTDRNAAWEGIAWGEGKLYLANERQSGRLIVVDPSSGRVERSFVVRPSFSKARDVHYSDLSWWEGALYVLLRENRVILKVEPSTGRVLAEYDCGEMERQIEVVYHTRHPGLEGLAVEENYFWLVTDNNGEPRWKYREDRRPTLFKCLRPDRPARAALR